MRHVHTSKLALHTSVVYIAHAGAPFALNCLCQSLFEFKKVNRGRDRHSQGSKPEVTGIPRSPLLALDDAFYKAHSALTI